MVKVEPLPGLLVTSIVPPSMVAEVLGDGQAEPGAAEVAGGRGVGLGEGLEQPADLLLGHADAGVGHVEGDARLAGCGLRSRETASVTVAVLGELRGVAQQVDQALLELGQVGAHRADVGRAVDHQPCCRSSSTSGSIDGLHLVDQAGEIDLLEIDVHAAGFDLRQIEDVVDQAEQMLAGALDLLSDRRRLASSPRSVASSTRISL